MLSAVVTGAAGGIGSAVVERLHREGIAVIATDLRFPEGVALPDGVRCVPVDLTDPGAVDTLFEEQVGNELDYLVNAAGVALFGRDGSVLNSTEETWELVFAINLEALRRVTVAAVPKLRRGAGRSIVHIASIAGLRAMDSPLDAYQVSKAAVISLSRSLAIQLGPEQIRSNTVCPGAILTPMIEPLYRDSTDRQRDMEERTPLRRLGRPVEVAAAVAFLLSQDASFITATDVVVDGGWLAQVR